MGMIVWFPGQHHGCVSATSKPKSSGLASRPSLASAPLKIRNFSDGIRPRARQLLTADDPTPANAATADVPPRALIMPSTVVSIRSGYSRFVNMSSVHRMEIVTDCELRPNSVMLVRSPVDVAYRLQIAQEILGLKAAELCRLTGIKPNQWSQFLNPDMKRRITLEAAYKIKDEFGITLEWIYDGDRNRLPAHFVKRLLELEAKAQPKKRAQ